MTKTLSRSDMLSQAPEQAHAEPVFIEKAGQVHTVNSARRCGELLGVEAGESLAERTGWFQVQYKDWIEGQNRHFEKHGLWNDELRLW